MASDTTGLVTLSEQECLRLLRTHPIAVGRFGVTDTDGHPLIIPANYRLDGDTVVVRTGIGSVLADRAAGHKVAFQVDEIDPAWQEGWSVLRARRSRSPTRASWSGSDGCPCARGRRASARSTCRSCRAWSPAVGSRRHVR